MTGQWPLDRVDRTLIALPAGVACPDIAQGRAGTCGREVGPDPRVRRLCLEPPPQLPLRDGYAALGAGRRDRDSTRLRRSWRRERTLRGCVGGKPEARHPVTHRPGWCSLQHPCERCLQGGRVGDRGAHHRLQHRDQSREAVWPARLLLEGLPDIGGRERGTALLVLRFDDAANVHCQRCQSVRRRLGWPLRRYRTCPRP